MNNKKKPVVFLDRDGVINKDTGHLHKYKDFKWLPGVFDALKLIKEKNYLIIVISNQSGIGRGLYTENDVKFLHKKINIHLKKKINFKIDDFYYCPYHPKYGLGKYKKKSFDRKPNPGMILKAIKKWNIKKEESFMIGDKKSDYIASKKANIKFFYKSDQRFITQIKKIFGDIV